MEFSGNGAIFRKAIGDALSDGKVKKENTTHACSPGLVGLGLGLGPRCARE
jgi:hypothetical protein